MESKKKNKFIEKLRFKYRLVLMDAGTFEEKLSFRLSRMNVFIAVGALALILIFITAYIIAFTPLREFIPGYGSTRSDKLARELSLKADSLEEAIKNKDLYLLNLNNIIEGKEIVDKMPAKPDSLKVNANLNFGRSKEDSLLRVEQETQDKTGLAAEDNATGSSIADISSFFFFTPLKGLITNNYNPADNHYGIDIVAAKNEGIKSTLSGTVIFSGWTMQTGYTIVVQHADNIISVYKHNSALLKKEGESVQVGDVIAIIGESGELSTGPHLHFELWYRGTPVNPRDYMVFE